MNDAKRNLDMDDYEKIESVALRRDGHFTNDEIPRLADTIHALAREEGREL